MSETQTEYLTDAEPTPGPYKMIETTHGNKMLDAEGQIRTICKVYDTGREGDPKNVALIEATFEAAQEAKKLGYDPVAAVEALPDLMTSVERILDDIHSNDPAEPSAQAPTGEAIKSIKDALTRAEDRNDE